MRSENLLYAAVTAPLALFSAVAGVVLPLYCFGAVVVDAQKWASTENPFSPKAEFPRLWVNR